MEQLTLRFRLPLLHQPSTLLALEESSSHATVVRIEMLHADNKLTNFLQIGR